MLYCMNDMPNMMNPMMQGGGWAVPPMGPGNMNVSNYPNGNNFNNNGYGPGTNNWQQNQSQQGWNNTQQRGYGMQNGNYVSRGGGGNFQQNGFNKQHPNEEDSPYFRQPVNPHRHQKARRMRPSEFTELGRN